MSDLEKFAKQLGENKLTEIVLTHREIFPCAYSGGDCIVSFWLEKEEAYVKKAFCTRAKQVQDNFFGTYSVRSERLREVGCPNPNHTFFSGWKCKYADGKIHSL